MLKLISINARNVEAQGVIISIDIQQDKVLTL